MSQQVNGQPATRGLTLVRHGEAPRPVRVPYDGAPHSIAAGECPHCGTRPFSIRGTGLRPSADDRAREAGATCSDCGAPCGTLRLEADTLFGVREDESVLAGPWKVY